MIGNDIVDLKQALQDSNWQRPRFLDKIFSGKEQDYIFTSKDAFKTVWRLWSMKESAYKIYSKQHQKRVFNPKTFECVILNDTEGEVSIDNEYYQTTSLLNDKFIHTTALLNSKDRITTYCFTTNSNQYKVLSVLCRNRLKQDVANAIGVEKSTLSIKKNSIGIPQLYCDNEHIDVPFSITHHGNYGAYAMLEN